MSVKFANVVACALECKQRLMCLFVSTGGLIKKGILQLLQFFLVHENVWMEKSTSG